MLHRKQSKFGKKTYAKSTYHCFKIHIYFFSV